MAGIRELLPAAGRILREYSLCDSCLGRLLARRPGAPPSRLLGRRLRGGAAAPGRCYVCRDLSSSLGRMLDLMLEASSGREFATFAVGARVRPSVMDRDDLVRSKFRLRGADSFKTGLTRDLSRRFSRKAGGAPDALDPDLTLTVDTRDMSCAARAKPVVLYGAYAKTRRGFPQRQAPCAGCSGGGCAACGFHGIDSFDSVEGRISGDLFSRFGCSTVRFTWVGGEDRDSLVLGDGRPFFARIHDPDRRSPGLPRRIRLGPVELRGCRILAGLPRMPVRFSSTIKIRVSTEGPVSARALRRLKPSLLSPVVVYEPSGKRSEKSVSCTRYRRTSERGFCMVVEAEGGLPVRRFVEGDGVSPGISGILGGACACEGFDFLGVRANGNN